MLTVAIIGKPNVGKSTLFNRIIQSHKSIVDDQSGVTRDRIYGEAEWLTRRFILIDTGGLANQKEHFQEQINQQVTFAIEEADVILFCVSGKEGVDANDIFVSKTLKRLARKKPVILVVNKMEAIPDDLSSFYNLGFGEPTCVSGSHGVGVGNLLDQIIRFVDNEQLNYPASAHSFCIIGRPNVGKSSLVNAILNEERVIVSDLPGSTRDSTDSYFKYHHEDYIITDTAGIRRKGKLSGIEKVSVLKAQIAIKRSQMILLMLDGSEQFTEQDEVIGGLAYDANIPTIIVVNKWDLVPKVTNTMEQMRKKIRSQFKYLNWAPIIFISSLKKERLQTLFETMALIRQEVQIKVNTSLLNDVVLKAQMMQQAPLFKGSRVVISYATQVKSQIPTFVIFCNNPKYLHFSYARYIENQIRDAFGIHNVPITLYWKSKNTKVRGSEDV